MPTRPLNNDKPTYEQWMTALDLTGLFGIDGTYEAIDDETGSIIVAYGNHTVTIHTDGTTNLTKPGWFVVIEREFHPDAYIEYPDEASATRALGRSVFIDGLVEEDCLDIWPEENPNVHPDAEHIIPPEDDTDNEED